MMQVADDMHRMTDYIMDLRNMTIGLVCLSAIGVFLFLIMKLAQGRSSGAHRKRDVGKRLEALDDRSLSRHPHYYSTYQGYPDSWQEPPPALQKKGSSTTVIDMDKMNQNKPSQTKDTSERVHDLTLRPTENKNVPNGHAHKRLEPVKLLVEDLPYADT